MRKHIILLIILTSHVFSGTIYSSLSDSEKTLFGKLYKDVNSGCKHSVDHAKTKTEVFSLLESSCDLSDAVITIEKTVSSPEPEEVSWKVKKKQKDTWRTKLYYKLIDSVWNDIKKSSEPELNIKDVALLHMSPNELVDVPDRELVKWSTYSYFYRESGYMEIKHKKDEWTIIWSLPFDPLTGDSTAPVRGSQRKVSVYIKIYKNYNKIVSSIGENKYMDNILKTPFNRDCIGSLYSSFTCKEDWSFNKGVFPHFGIHYNDYK